MKNKFLTLIFALGGYGAYSQVGIGTQLPHESAQLEVVASNKGILIPRIELISSTDNTTIANGNVNSLLVFNKSNNSNIKPGYFYWFNNKWNRIVVDGDLTVAPGSVVFNSVTNEFSYIDESGNSNVINMGEVVKKYETITVLKNNEDGTYTYTNEAGASVVIDVPGDVADNFQTIVNNQTVQDILNTFITNSAGNVVYNPTTKEFSYVKDGVTHVINLKEIVGELETITVLKNNEDGTYTYTNEAGASVVIDVPGDVADNFQTIVNNQTVQDILNTFITNSAGNVVYNPTTKEFSYVKDGVTHVINLKEIVGELETITVLKNNEDGTYTYTNEAGATVVIDVPGDVADNFQTIVNNQTVQDILNTFITNSTGNVVYNPTTKEFSYVKDGVTHVINLKEIVGELETITVLKNNEDGTFTYTNEAGAAVTIDLTSIVNEPWFSTATNAGATSNLESIYTKGWVGIGYDTPSANPNEKLRVNGTVTTVNSTYADYVFEDYFDGFSDLKMDYKFKSLSEVEDFIKINKHLPGITPIHELEKTNEGYSFNMSELSIQLLEKTEELYLHIIELKNTIKEKDLELKERLGKLESNLNK